MPVAIEVGRKIRSLIADPQEGRSIGTYLRKRRWDTFRAQFPDVDQMHVVDLGGRAVHWQKFPIKPLSVTVVNLLPDTSESDSIHVVRADVCEEMPALQGKTFDLVYSNSLIEHVGGHLRRAAFAENVKKLAPHHWVQTPYRYFPIEPHWLFPGLQYLPDWLRAKAIRHWPLSPSKPDREHAMGEVLEIELLSRSQMKYYFDTSRILSERVLGVTKSLIAVS